MRKILHFFIYSNSLIAFAAVSACCTTYCLAGVMPLVDSLLWLVFFATLIGYILPRLIALQNMSKTTQDQFNIPRQLLYLRLLFMLSAGVSIYLFCLQIGAVQCLLVFMGSLTIFYSLPLIKWKGRWWKGRDIGILKIFLIATVWSISTALLPLIHLQEVEPINLTFGQLIGLSVERWLFIFAITLPFDIRDQQYDQERGLHTIPLLIGERRTLQLATFILMSLALGGVLYFNEDALGIALIIHYLIVVYIINQTHPKKEDEFYTGLLDSTIIMQLMWVGLSLWF